MSRVASANARGPLRCRAQATDGQDPARVQQALQEAMKDPEARVHVGKCTIAHRHHTTQTRARMEQMQQAMQNPEVQRQMQEMAAFMSNQSVMQRIAELREDPELKPMFDEIKSGGMQSLMKFMNDPRVCLCCLAGGDGTMSNIHHHRFSPKLAKSWATSQTTSQPRQGPPGPACPPPSQRSTTSWTQHGTGVVE